MTTAVVCIVCIAMIVVGCMTLSQGILTSADTAALSAQQLSVREGEIMRTGLTGVSASLPSANTLRAVIENSGQTKLASFNKWDYIVQYYDASDNYYVNWLPYHYGALGNNQWHETGLFYNGGAEAFEPGILNPQEQLHLEAVLNPAAGYRAIALTLATPNGVAPTVVCGPPVLTAHTETVAAGGSNYFMLKGWTPANGAGVTDTSGSIGVDQTGRWLLHDSAEPSDTAIHCFPLSGVNGIKASDWTVHYRGRADGWIDGSLANAFLSIDIVVRKADGSLREMIAADVAPASFTISDDWEDISKVYSFPGYTVVDDTDYLEIDFYGDSEGDGPRSTSRLYLRVDDGALTVSSQTRIVGLSWE